MLRSPSRGIGCRYVSVFACNLFVRGDSGPRKIMSFGYVFPFFLFSIRVDTGSVEFLKILFVEGQNARRKYIVVRTLLGRRRSCTGGW